MTRTKVRIKLRRKEGGAAATLSGTPRPADTADFVTLDQLREILQNYLPLTGGKITGPLEVTGNATLGGSLSVGGNVTISGLTRVNAQIFVKEMFFQNGADDDTVQPYITRDKGKLTFAFHRNNVYHSSPLTLSPDGEMTLNGTFHSTAGISSEGYISMLKKLEQEVNPSEPFL